MCSTCEDTYNEDDKMPLVLACGHTACKSCLLLVNEKHDFIICLTCRMKFKQYYKDVYQAGVNLEVLISVKLLKVKELAKK